MCRRWMAVIGCTIGISAQAQDTSLAARGRAVAAAYARMEAVYAGARADSLRTASLPVVRRYAGMEVHADTTQIPARFFSTLDDGFNAALRESVALFGPQAHALLTGMRLTITRGTSGELIEDRDRSPYVTLRTDPFGRRSYSYQTAEVADPIYEIFESLFFRWFGDAAMEGAPAPIRIWAGQVLPVEQRPLANRATYVDVARTNAKASRACLEGALQACRSLLAIEVHNDTIGSWLDAGERRAMLLRLKAERYGLSRRFFSNEGIALYNRCAQDGDDVACRDALRYMRTSAPVGSHGRAELVRRALELGGPEAYSRLQGARGSDIGSMLAATAGMPLDALIARWRSDIIAARRESPLPNAPELTTSLVLCAMALAACAGRRP